MEPKEKKMKLLKFSRFVSFTSIFYDCLVNDLKRVHHGALASRDFLTGASPLDNLCNWTCIAPHLYILKIVPNPDLMQLLTKMSSYVSLDFGRRLFRFAQVAFYPQREIN